MFFSLGYLELANAVVMNEFLLHIFVSVFYSKNIPVSSAFVVASYADSFQARHAIFLCHFREEERSRDERKGRLLRRLLLQKKNASAPPLQKY